MIVVKSINELISIKDIILFDITLFTDAGQEGINIFDF
jgi:hypothetical protein